MNRLTMVFAAGAISLSTAAALAQEPPRMGGGGFRSIAHLCATDQQWTTQRLAERLARRLNLTDQQKPALQALQEAVAKAKGDAKAVLCGSPPDLSSLPARLAFVQKRLQARLDGMKAVQPKLEAFYTALNGEQQAEFNELWQRHGMRGQGGEGERGMRGQGGEGMRGWRGEGEGGWRRGGQPGGGQFGDGQSGGGRPSEQQGEDD